MSIKGFPSQKKIKGSIPGLSDQQAIPESQFVTVIPRGSDRYAADVMAVGYYELSIGNSIISATDRAISKTSHGARVGDVIRFTSGVLSAMEFTVHSVPTANIIVIGSQFDTNPSIGDTFSILRPISPLFDSSGKTLASVTVTGVSQESTQLLVKANTDRLQVLGGCLVDFVTAPHTGGSFASIFTVPAGKTAYKIRIVQNGGNDFKFRLNGGSVIGYIPAGEKGDIELTLNSEETFDIDTVSGDATSGKLFINFMGV